MGRWAWLALLLLGLGVLAARDQAWKKKKLVQEMEHLFTMEELGHAQGPPQSPPGFMLDLFQRVAYPSGITKDPHILIGNMVRCFQEKVHVNHSHFFFIISSVGKHEKVLRAELHVFKLQHVQKTSVPGKAHHYHRVEVHEILGSTLESKRGSLLSARDLPLTSYGWLVFGVTQTVTGRGSVARLQDLGTLHDLRLRLVGSNSLGLKLSPGEHRACAAGCCSQVASWIQGQDLARSFLVLTTKNVGKLLTYSYGGINRKWNGKDKRNSLLVICTNNQDKEPPRKDYATLPTEHLPLREPPSNYPRQPRSVRHSSRRPVGCQRYLLYVDFQTIGWRSWVISPPGYQVNYCKGQCIHPLGHRSNASNYTFFVSFLCHFKMNPNISRPSCVPNKLNSISLLYFNEQKVVVLWQYTDMTVDSCGCH
ncbi:protein decapentaplegic-like [Trichechus manatus latirostris]|uniref:Protein decapentaplegic-like n=1 Tax=Trichechus manatus latirostris TaxID=127582 RepID=A0A2Y9G370_TRIMA|nr:protein decapentaplegic-like [Trichechus manatus latirostris]